MSFISRSIKDYFQNSTVHGLRYLAEDGSVFAKLFWLATVVSCLCSAVISFGMAMHDWDTTPLVTTIESLDSALDTIQFPTITVCPETMLTSVEDMFMPLVNGIKYQCQPLSLDEEPDCDDTIRIRTLLKPYVRQMIEDAYENIKPKGFFDILFCQVNTAVALNLTSKETILRQVSDAFGKIGYMEKLLYWFESLFDNEELMRNLTEGKPTAPETCLHGKNLGTLFFTFMKVERFSLIDMFVTLFKHLSSNSLLELKEALLQDIANQLDLVRNDSFKVLADLNMRNEEYPQARNLSCLMKMNRGPLIGNCGLKAINNVTPDLKKAMAVLKHGIPQSGYMATSGDLLRRVFNVTDTLAGFNISNHTKRRFEWNWSSSIPFCRFPFNNMEVSDEWCNHFLPVPTNHGFCHAFNAPHITTLLKVPSVYHDAMVQVFEPEYSMQQLPKDIHLSQSDYQLNFAVTNNNPGYDYNRFKGGFFFGVSDKMAFFDVMSNPIKIQFGYHSTVYIQPEVKMSYDIESLALEKRKCRFSDEPIVDDYSVFSFYSKETCVQECRLAYSVVKCGCKAWDLPYSPGDEESPRCSQLGNQCVFNTLSNATSDTVDQCESRCLSNCNQIRFEVVRIERVKLDRKICQIYSSVDSSYWQYKKFHHYDYLATPLANYSARSSTLDCLRDFTTNTALVTVRLASSTFTKYSQSVRIDINGKISNLGGILGLFSGMSFISMVELVFWIIKSISQRICSRSRGADPDTDHH